MTLCINNVSFSRHSKLLFQQIHFTLSSGELLQVMGHNGAGKSSLLRILCGLLQPHVGNIYWNNVSIAKSLDYHQSLFYLGHARALRDELTVMENIVYTLQNHALLADEINCVLREWQLMTLKNQLCGALSMGQQQRVALACMTLSLKKIWILDEPLSHLDATGVLQFEKILSLHLTNGGFCIVATHQTMQIPGIQRHVLVL